MNEPVRAAAAGKIVPSLCGGKNHQLVIDHCNGFQTFYLHLSTWTNTIETAIKNNDVNFMVESGSLIGLVGNIGASTAPHLHFEVHRLDQETQQYNVSDPYGYFSEDGSVIDPQLWISGQ